jgi:hypothetical protein
LLSGLISYTNPTRLRRLVRLSLAYAVAFRLSLQLVGARTARSSLSWQEAKPSKREWRVGPTLNMLRASTRHVVMSDLPYTNDKGRRKMNPDTKHALIVGGAG